jgi:hypothetical protein
VSWKDSNTLAIEYSVPAVPEAKSLERRLNDPGWQAPGR